MPVHLEDVDVCELLQQAVGEYSERLGAGQLTPVFDLPEEPVLIRADGALLWRVIDNLLSNICKYALPGTRLYISMERSGEQMTVQMKNVSRAPLNIPADELMERFVRGDSSRNSEGSGLGLSIAQSLTELMGGAFRLEIDGDLFKAKLDFPVILRPAWLSHAADGSRGTRWTILVGERKMPSLPPRMRGREGIFTDPEAAFPTERRSRTVSNGSDLYFFKLRKTTRMSVPWSTMLCSSICAL